jgi:hypothetical protein
LVVEVVGSVDAERLVPNQAIASLHLLAVNRTPNCYGRIRKSPYHGEVRIFKAPTRSILQCHPVSSNQNKFERKINKS